MDVLTTEGPPNWLNAESLVEANSVSAFAIAKVTVPLVPFTPSLVAEKFLGLVGQ